MKATTTLIRAISLILALFLLSSPGIAQSGGLADSNALAYEKALQMLTTSSLTDGSKLEDIRVQFAQAGSYQFGVEYLTFVEALLMLQSENANRFDVALNNTRRLSKYDRFTKNYYGQLDRLGQPILPDLELLMQYIIGRKLEDQGDMEGAIARYDSYPVLDAFSRAGSLSSIMMEEKYSMANDLLSEDSLPSVRQAASLYEALGDYRDSPVRLIECRKRIEELATSTPAPNPTKTPTPTPTEEFIPEPESILQPPTSISLLITLDSIIVRWTLAGGAQKCNVYRADSINGSLVLIATVIGREYKDTAIAAGGTYYYRLSSVKDNMESELSRQYASSVPMPTPKLPMVGEIVTFGSYEQDNNLSNGKETIVWRVLAVKGDKALLISYYNLDCKPYNTHITNITWRTSSILMWLNTEFIDAAFSKEQSNAILMSEMDIEKSIGDGISRNKSTVAKVFILSDTEAEQLFAGDADRIAYTTSYAKDNGAKTLGSGEGWYWLRSTGYGTGKATCVSYGGSIYYYGLDMNDDETAVRPALWVDLSSGLF